MLKILDFHIRPQSQDTYNLEIFARNSSQPLTKTTFDLRLDSLTGFTLAGLANVKNPSERLNALVSYGQRLYQTLFKLEVQQVWQSHAQQTQHPDLLVLCLRIAPEADKLEALPWETLHDGEEFIAAGVRTTLTRLPLDVAPQNELPLIPRPLKMFAFVSSPLDLQDHQRLNVEREQEILLEAINDPRGQGSLDAEFEDEAKLEILERSLESSYHIFHYTGHGVAPENGGGLYLENLQGKLQAFSVADVMQALKKGVGAMRLAVISGCQTARTLHTGGFRDLARELLRNRVPAVIAMQFSITDEAGLKFAAEFYPRIAAGQPLELAVHAARRALLYSEHDHLKADALAPVLLAANGECLKTTEAEAASDESHPEIDPAWFLPLPQLSFGFYGRRREYRQIRDGLLAQNHRAVIIHGIGGIGKTALVSHAAERLRRRFKGVYAFDCRSGAIAPETILLQLNIYFANQGINALQKYVGQSVPPEMLANFIGQVLSQWPMLVIFDNFEDVLDEERRIANENLRAFITTLVKTTAKGSHFLFTTRYRFDLDGKRPGNIQELALDDLSRAEALNLMQKLPNLARTSHGEKLAAFEKFGGHPYAMVTLDRHCHHQPLSRALEEASKVHAELREFLAIELNYRRLSEPARELLNRLAAFRQAVSFEAAEWVMGEDVPLTIESLLAMRDKLPKELKLFDDETLRQKLGQFSLKFRRSPDVAEQIRELIDWGLLTPYHEDGALKSLSVHSLVRDFCRDQQQDESWRGHLRNAAAFYTNQTRLLGEYDKTEAAVWGEMEAFELLMGAEDFADAAVLIGKVTLILRRWGYGHYLESQYRRLLDKLNQCGMAVIRHNLGVLLQDRGDYGAALRQYQFSLDILEELGDCAGVASALHQIGTIHRDRGDYDMALQQYQLSLKIFEELGDRANVAQSLHQIGIIYQLHGDYDVALQQYQLSLKIEEELGDRAGVARSLHQIGMIHQYRSDYDVALQQYQLSLKIFEELGDRAGIASSLGQIGIIHQLRSDYDAALQQYQLSLKINEELGDRGGIALSLAQIGKLFTEPGHYVEAFRHLLFALSIFIELQSPDAGIVANNLKTLRAKWGEREFDAAWQEATGEATPDWLKEAEAV